MSCAPSLQTRPRGARASLPLQAQTVTGVTKHACTSQETATGMPRLAEKPEETGKVVKKPVSTCKLSRKKVLIM